MIRLAEDGAPAGGRDRTDFAGAPVSNLGVKSAYALYLHI